MDDLSRAQTLGADEQDAPERDADALVGRVLDGRYRIVGRLGEGGMGLVYEATHEVLKSRLAVKVLRADASANREAIERLEREAQSASAIGNDHIVDVRDFGRLPDGSTYVVMELIEGADLFRTIKEGPLPWKRARHIALQICEALGAAHDRGIVHRDLKPENVILTVRRGRDDFVKIVDFGIAKVQGGAKLTVAGRVMGTPEYMSPEQCAGRTVDARTDIYALGVMLYEMVTGNLPFYDPDLVKLVRMQLHDTPAPPSKVHPEGQLPLPLEAVILRLLAKNPAHRFESMAAVADALREVDAEGAVSSATLAAGSDGLEAAAAPQSAAGAGEAAERTGAGRALGSAPSAEAPTVQPASDSGAVAADGGRSRLPWLLVACGLLAAAGIGAWALAGPDEAASEGDSPSRADAPRASPGPGQGSAVADGPAAGGGAPTAELADGEPAAGDAPVTEATGAEATGTEATGAEATRAEAAARSAEIEVTSDPSGVQIYQGDALLGQTPLRLRRPDEGERAELTLRHRGYRERSVVLGAWSQPELHLTLERAPRVPSAPPASSTTSGRPPPSRPASGGPASTGHRPHREFRDPWADDG